MIDYVLNCTKQKTLRFVGYSMGATVLFTLLSMKPEYNTKIKLGIYLGLPIAGKEIPSIIQFVHDEFFDVNEIYEVASLSSTTITIGRTLCVDKAITQAICIAILSSGFGSDPAQFNTTALPELFSHVPAGSSVQLLHHY
ncbi:PREDICTED: lipase member N-like [Wasmannia auropunctata]|uniref:lipase member N-like n=1 Tax=Wasmannia auropunctata TaxID=64793 RepID=UPI0005EFBBEE|nr:PREDICTED: lipase member N-like [Wasmannia auropunctata]